MIAFAFAMVSGLLASGLAGREMELTSGEAAPAPFLTAYAHVNGNATIAHSRGAVKIKEGDKPNQYCFDLEFVPKVAVASAFWSNGAWVSTATKGDNFNTGCDAPYDDAAAQVFTNPIGAANDVGFKIVFHR